MIDHHNKQTGCCGEKEHREHNQPEKEKDGCCDNVAKKSDQKKAEKQSGCCGGGK
ncbi:hypothetical protein [Paremcibacter congregatus]|uniref:hypothetical protein n=1 Tax=Paremcibacter congregatus TaxID=2043170 RepID=UPI0030EB2815|tara:strand:- start:678 stop:842 length:165 start_codon:yes stop_codon:yes gene_type:complete